MKSSRLFNNISEKSAMFIFTSATRCHMVIFTTLRTSGITYFWFFIVLSVSFSFARSFLMILECCNCCFDNFSPSSLSSRIISSFSATKDSSSPIDSRDAASCFACYNNNNKGFILHPSNLVKTLFGHIYTNNYIAKVQQIHSTRVWRYLVFSGVLFQSFSVFT